MRTLVEIAKDIRKAQRIAYDIEVAYLHSDYDDFDVPSDRDVYDEDFSALMNEFSRTIGIFENDEFASSTYAILTTIQKHLSFDDLEDKYHDIREYIDCDENPTVEGISKLMDEHRHY